MCGRVLVGYDVGVGNGGHEDWRGRREPRGPPKSHKIAIRGLIRYLGTGLAGGTQDST